MKVDPAKLEAEAEEMMAQLKGTAQAPQQEETPEQPEPEVVAQAPEEPTDTAEEPQQAPTEDDSGETSEAELALKRLTNATRMHKGR